MQLLRFFRTASHGANFLFVAATIVLLIKILLLNLYPTYIYGVYELGMMFEAILASIIASYIFYLLVVHLKEQSDKDTLQPYIGKYSRNVVSDCVRLLCAISEASRTHLDLSRSSEIDLRNALSKIPPQSGAPMQIAAQTTQQANWNQYLTHCQQNTDSSIRKLFAQLRFLEAEHVAKLTAVDDCSFIARFHTLQSVLAKNPNLSAWTNPIFRYCQLCLELDQQNVKLGFASALS